MTVNQAVIQTVGLQWDQGRIGYAEGPCGFLAQPDFERVRSRVKKFDDIAREFAVVGLTRMRRAEAARQGGHMVSASTVSSPASCSARLNGRSSRTPKRTFASSRLRTLPTRGTPGCRPPCPAG
jgi:hypothetical protein